MSQTLAPLAQDLPVLPEPPFAPKQSRPMSMERYTQEDSIAAHGGVLDAAPRQSYPYTLSLIEQASPLTILAEFTRGFTGIQVSRAYGLDPLNFALWMERLPPDMKATKAIAEKAYVEHAELILARRLPATKVEADHLKTTLQVLSEKYNRATLMAAGIVPVDSKDKLEFHIHIAPPTPPAISDPSHDPLKDIIDVTPYDPRARAATPGKPDSNAHPNARDNHRYAQAPTPPLPINQMMQQLDAGEDYFDED